MINFFRSIFQNDHTNLDSHEDDDRSSTKQPPWWKRKKYVILKAGDEDTEPVLVAENDEDAPEETNVPYLANGKMNIKET